MYPLVFFAVIYQASSSNCTHPVYCQGPILDAVQTLGVFKDSKEFVDMPMKLSQQEVLQNWQQVANTSDIQQVTAFVNDNFQPAGSDSQPVIPSDWSDSPPFANKIKNEKLKQWGLQVNAIWKTLSKQFTMKQNQSSFIETPFPFVIAGGRFREFYYWDSLWITEGLILSGMIDTAIAMLRNFGSVINQYGYVPNGARIYFLGRSQPPVTAMMSELIFTELRAQGRYQHAYNLLKEVYPIIQKEYQFWVTQRSIKASDALGIDSNVLLFHYDGQPTPRPESYKEDIASAATLSDKETFYRNIWAACESGLDFSSRWFKDPNDIKTVRASDIIPLDLNVFITRNEYILSTYASHLEDFTQASAYETLAQSRQALLLSTFFNPAMSQWNDYVLSTKSFNNNYYPSNFAPLILLPKNDPLYTQVRGELKKIVDQYPGGIPQSLVDNKQQWDYPNSWAPFNHLIVQALLKHNDSELSLQVAQQWINNNYCSFQNAKTTYGEGYMFEKYDAVSVGKQGGGGEYEIQKGFGWTNGVAISFLDRFSDQLKMDYC